jgi:hypothetical protein
VHSKTNVLPLTQQLESTLKGVRLESEFLGNMLLNILLNADVCRHQQHCHHPKAVDGQLLPPSSSASYAAAPLGPVP